MNASSKTVITNQPDIIQGAVLIKQLMNHATENEYSFALWRLPESDETNFIVSYSKNIFSAEGTLEDSAEGFIFAPFLAEQPAEFLKADLSFTFKKGTLCEPLNPIQVYSQGKVHELISTSRPEKIKLYSGENATIKTSSQPEFEKLVQKGIEQIEKSKLEKIVPSRSRYISLPQDFDCLEAFQKLCKAYPNAMVSLVGIARKGTWLGATPELLVHIEDNKIFRTVALAGTKPYEEGTPVKQVAWTQKEIEEQALVSRYIINCFKKIRLREFEEHGPKTIIAGNLMHLKTDFSVDMVATNFPQLGSVMLRLLHPTSAVCGMPLEPALEFLKAHEGYDREFYAGYFGPVNVKNNTHLFVNLRCMQVYETMAVIYAGAGVTIDSDPSHEWKETEMKMNTLLNVIF